MLVGYDTDAGTYDEEVDGKRVNEVYAPLVLVPDVTVAVPPFEVVNVEMVSDSVPPFEVVSVMYVTEFPDELVPVSSVNVTVPPFEVVSVT